MKITPGLVKSALIFILVMILLFGFMGAEASTYVPYVAIGLLIVTVGSAVAYFASRRKQRH